MASRSTNLDLAKEVVEALRKRNLHITAVESCTGGGFVYYITNIPGASDVIKDGFVTYSTEAKLALGVPSKIIEKHTVYSMETAIEMAKIGLARSIQANIAVGITGSISRVDPNNPNSVPGEIYIAAIYGDRTLSRCLRVDRETRVEVKDEIIESALQLVLEAIRT